jgi:hypothetical protein
VDPARFDDYAGTYVLEEDSSLLLLSRDADRLLLAFGEPPGLPLVPMEENRFLLPPMNYEVSFTRATDGAITGLTFHITETSIRRSPARDIPGAKQILPIRTTAELDQEFGGHYYSPELETIYVISAEDDSLMIRHPRHGQVPLTPLTADVYLADTKVFTQVSFLRDAQDRVTGMRLRGFSWNSSATFERVQLP